jgi:hypothetical protein
MPCSGGMGVIVINYYNPSVSGASGISGPNNNNFPEAMFLSPGCPLESLRIP